MLSKNSSQKSETPLSDARKRTSMGFNKIGFDDYIVLEGDQNELEDNYDDNDDEEDLNYEGNFKKRKSLVEKTHVCRTPLTTPKPSTSKDNQVLEQRDIALSKKQYLADRIDRISEFTQKCKSEIVCEYITNCVESMRLLLYKQYNLDTETQKINWENSKIFSIGLAVLKSVKHSDEINRVNLLIKRYTVQIEMLDQTENVSEDDLDEDNEINNDILLMNKLEWQFRDSILKCLYSQDFQYPANFKWQIQLRTSTSQMREISNKEDLFKLFAWRECDSEEITSVANKQNDENLQNIRKISIKPIKTIEHFNKNANIRMQLFIEQPAIPVYNSVDGSSRFNIKSTQQLSKNKKLIRKANSNRDSNNELNSEESN